MSIDSVTSYNPNNINDTLYAYQSNRTVGTSTIQQVPKTNYTSSVSLDTPPDTFELSSESKIRGKSENNKNKSMSTGLKWLLGTAGVVAAGFAAHKFVPPMLVKSRVEKIFLRDFSKDEAKAIQKKYQDILKIKNKNEAVDKMFEELKKDYKIDDLTIKVDKTFKSGKKEGEITAAAHTLPYYDKGFIEVGVDMQNFDLPELFKHITHELRHIKQHKLSFQTSTKEDYIRIMTERCKAVFPDKSEVTCKNWAEEESKDFNNFFVSHNVKKISKDDKNYEWGRKILESQKIYANGSKENYHSHAFYETDAKATEILMNKMINNRLF